MLLKAGNNLHHRHGVLKNWSLALKYQVRKYPTLASCKTGLTEERKISRFEGITLFIQTERGCF